MTKTDAGNQPTNNQHHYNNYNNNKEAEAEATKIKKLCIV